MHSIFFKALGFRALIGNIKGQCLSTLRVHTAVVCVVCGQNRGSEAPLVFLLVFQGKQYWESFSIPPRPTTFSPFFSSDFFTLNTYSLPVVLAQLHLLTSFNILSVLYTYIILLGARFSREIVFLY